MAKVARCTYTTGAIENGKSCDGDFAFSGASCYAATVVTAWNKTVCENLWAIRNGSKCLAINEWATADNGKIITSYVCPTWYKTADSPVASNSTCTKEVNEETKAVCDMYGKLRRDKGYSRNIGSLYRVFIRLGYQQKTK